MAWHKFKFIPLVLFLCGVNITHAEEPLTFPITFEAAFEEEGAIITRALEWKIIKQGFEGEAETLQAQDEAPQSQEESLQGQEEAVQTEGSQNANPPSESIFSDNTPRPTFLLPLGRYTAVVAYGLAETRLDFVVTARAETHRLLVVGGGLHIKGRAGERDIPDQRVSYSMRPLDPASPFSRVDAEFAAGQVYRLPSGLYTVTARYGEANAFMQADLRVETGRITNATMQFRAATVTLKLVTQSGGEALANTGWTVLTPGGDTVFETEGAFPSVALAEGDYNVIARHDRKIYNRPFSVVPGINAEVEVIVTE